MFVEEARWIRQAIESLNLSSGTSVADVGSSDLFVRTRIQPHIEEHIYRPLRERGVSITSCDSKPELGVDHVIDICTSEETPFNVVGKKFDLVLCANMLEHVVDRARAVRNLLTLVQPGGYLLMTVPRTYFYHEDPIDTMYRPLPSELSALVLRHAHGEAVTEQVLSITDRQYYLMPVYPNILLHNIPFWGYRQAWRWFFKPFRWKVSCVVVRIDSFSENR